MPAGATEIHQEGLRIPGIRIVAAGELDEELLEFVLANVRNPAERRADLRAQLAANERGGERIADLLDTYGSGRLRDGFDAVLDYSRDRIEAEIAAIPDGTYEAEDVLEGDGVTEDDIPIAATVTVTDTEVTVDFAGTADQVAGNMNAPLAVATSAVYFAVRAVSDPEIQPNQGCYDPITVSAPEGSLLNPTPPAAVVGGNVETSQRVTDVVLAAFSEALPETVPAQAQGTMNNTIIGSQRADGESEGFTYYETVGGGDGAGPETDGMDGVQVGMTNTLNTPIEALETEYPLFVERYALRDGSGGDGRHRGGLGIERSVRIEADAVVSLLTERRRHAPQGAAGGESGATGENLINGESVPAKTTVEVPAGTTVTVRTPGGGGYGDPGERTEAKRERDRRDGKAGVAPTTDDSASATDD
jgi:N-methylhydantoinase B